MNLKKDPRLREKLQLDDPDKTPVKFSTIYYEWINRKLKRNEDY
jgi:hypothetical protein